MKKQWIYRGLKALFVLSLAGPTYGKITQDEQFLESFTGLGYPAYLSQILLAAYILGLIAIFQSKFDLIKEWAYAGFTFALTGAVLSHIISGEAPRGGMALIGLAFLLGTYFMEKKIKEPKKERVSAFA